MYLTSKVIFNLKTDKLLFPGHSVDGMFIMRRSDIAYVENWQEFCAFLAKLKDTAEHGINKGTYMININRNVTISDQDDRVEFKSITFPDKKMSVILSTTGELTYVNDIEKLFRAKLPDFNFNAPKIKDTRPIYIEAFDGYDVNYRPLTQNGVTNDFVIDMNGNQLWPKNTGKLLPPLIQLLNKTTEKVH